MYLIQAAPDLSHDHSINKSAINKSETAPPSETHTMANTQTNRVGRINISRPNKTHHKEHKSPDLHHNANTPIEETIRQTKKNKRWIPWHPRNPKHLKTNIGCVCASENNKIMARTKHMNNKRNCRTKASNAQSTTRNEHQTHTHTHTPNL